MEGERMIVRRQPPILWRPIREVPPFVTVLLYRAGDLYPVVGWRQDDDLFILEEGGAEDGLRRKHPRIEWQPTHFAEIPKTPEGLAEEDAAELRGVLSNGRPATPPRKRATDLKNRRQRLTAPGGAGVE